MNINMKHYLSDFIKESYTDYEDFLIHLPDITLDPKNIKTIMINEVVANAIEDDFYSSYTNPAYLETTFALFKEAGIEVHSMQDIIELGIYVTNAIKLPKFNQEIKTDTVAYHAPILEKELAMFNNLKVIMLMGDVAKKAFNQITKKQTKKNAVPNISTYKLRNTEVYYNTIRIFPSYIMTGKNILIEKSKFQMASEDIKNMMEIIK